MPSKIIYPLTKPYYGREERRLVNKVIKSGWLIDGPYVREFENMFADYVGAKYAVATSSCTTALQIALLECGVKNGDEVIVPAFGWIATSNSVVAVGATPVFVDVYCDTRMDMNEVSFKITEKTKAIIVVHQVGIPSDVESIKEYLSTINRNDITIIEDCACSLGVKIGDKHTGTFGRVGCFSFHPRKTITTGEGGMLITNDYAAYLFYKSYVNHGAETRQQDLVKSSSMSDFYCHGSNYRMTNMQGALGVCQMKKLDKILSLKEELLREYKRHDYFWDISNSLLAVKFCNNQKELIEYLISKGIQCRQLSHSSAIMGINSKYTKGESFSNSIYISSNTICVPLYPSMRKKDIRFIVNKLHKYEME